MTRHKKKRLLKTSFEHVFILSYLLKWTVLAVPMSIAVGSLIAFFLWLLDKAIHFRFGHPWLLFLLPAAGVLIYGLYTYLGKNSDKGNNLIMDEIHEPGGGVPFRMAPLVLITTVITHLFGGSAGREGTAVQIGGSIAQFFAKKLKLSQEDVKTFLMTGIAAGFGAVFGTPITGAIFALEVLALGRIKHDALLPCFIASVVADITCAAWGIHHTHYAIRFAEEGKVFFGIFHLDIVLLLKVILGGVLFGLAGYIFAELSHTIKNYSNRFIRIKWLIPFIGGCIVIALTCIIGTQDYLSLGVSNPDPDAVSILSCFKAGGATDFSWFWKLLFTAVTLGMGFKGGEVTPLFFVGAALGNTIAAHTGAPADLMAGLGFIAVFASATNTPIACTFMGIELFGADNVLYYAVACFTAYYFSGHAGIYHAQRIAVSKVHHLNHHNNATLHEVREKRIKSRKKWRITK
ncbi:voltage-gated chloride channel protein [Niabella ginsenosidivorans]|uniref:Voltage-gated chloride channel protein n=1 Tax=Niabella ginsenosidivorans TaxID=1176587 RepID=A0A1A9I2N8_9BACT|nr:voltage-gated chloride channel family protein [Niabella ginsenosidivorans]ANH80961.1 voltage-gated chloride channel protein [Niabella ginsenosidivorans]